MKFSRWDPVQHLKTEADRAAYLAAAIKEAGDDPVFMAAVHADIFNSRQPSITCPICQRTSYNSTDIKEGYCGHCRAWTTVK